MVGSPKDLMEQLRSDLRREQVTEKPLWKYFLENDSATWRERCVLLYDFPTEASPKWRSSHCEACSGKDHRWTVLWGWPGDVPPVPTLAIVVVPSPNPPKSRASFVSQGDAFTAAWQHTQVRKTRNCKFASVGDLLQVMGTGAARRKRKRLDEHFCTWPRKLKLKAGSLEYFTELRSRSGVVQLSIDFVGPNYIILSHSSYISVVIYELFRAPNCSYFCVAFVHRYVTWKSVVFTSAARVGCCGMESFSM